MNPWITTDSVRVSNSSSDIISYLRPWCGIMYDCAITTQMPRQPLLQCVLRCISILISPVGNVASALHDTQWRVFCRVFNGLWLIEPTHYERGRDMTCNILSLFVSIWFNSYCGVENCSILQRKGRAYIGAIVTRSTRGPAATTDDSRHVLWPPLSANPWKGSDVRNNGAAIEHHE